MHTDSQQRGTTAKRQFEPDQPPVKALFVIVGGLTVGVFLVGVTVWQFYMATFDAEKEAKAGAPLPVLVDLRQAEQAELTGYGRVGCPESSALTPDGAAGAAPDCSPEEALYYVPVQQAAQKVLTNASLLSSIPLPNAPAAAAPEMAPRPLRLAPGAAGGGKLTVKNPALLRKRLSADDQGKAMVPKLPSDRRDLQKRK